MVVSLLQLSYTTFKLTRNQIRVIGGVQQRNTSATKSSHIISHKLFYCANRLNVRQRPQLCNHRGLQMRFITAI